MENVKMNYTGSFEEFMRDLELTSIYEKYEEVFVKILEKVQEDDMYTSLSTFSLLGLVHAVNYGSFSNAQEALLYPLFDIRDEFSDEEYLVTLPLEYLVCRKDLMEELRTRYSFNRDNVTDSNAFG